MYGAYFSPAEDLDAITDKIYIKISGCVHGAQPFVRMLWKMRRCRVDWHYCGYRQDQSNIDEIKQQLSPAEIHSKDNRMAIILN